MSEGIILNGDAGNDYIGTILIEHSTINGGDDDDTIDNGMFESGLSANYNVINGGNGNDSIYSSGWHTTINGGKGDDTINGGETILYADSDGDDLIRDINENNTIQITSGQLNDTVINDLDLILKIGNGSIKIAEGRLSTINVKNSNGTVTTISPAFSVIKNFYDNTIISGNDNDDYIKNRSSNVTINSGNGNDYIDTGSRITVNGGKGDDTIYIGSNNLIQYKNGDGNDVMLNYNEDWQDTIKIVDGDYTTLEDDNDLIIKVGEGSILIKGAKNKAVNIIGNNISTPTVPAATPTIPAATPTIPVVFEDATLNNKNNSQFFAKSNILKIDASARTKAVNIMANANDNLIIGSSKSDNITTGNGNDTIVYSAGQGTDIITDYTEGKDIIQIVEGTLASAAMSSSTLKLTIKNGNTKSTLKLQNVKDKKITIVDSEGNNLMGSQIYGQKKLTLNDTDDDKIDVSLNTKATTLDASKRTKSINLIGNTKANKLIGSSANDTLFGGTGKDTLTGGNGSDVFIYKSGNAVITDYSSS